MRDMAAADTTALAAPAASAPAAAAPASAPAAPAAPAAATPDSGAPQTTPQPAPQGTAEAVAAKPEDGKGPRQGESPIEFLNRVQLDKLKAGEQPAVEAPPEVPVVENPDDQKPADEVKPDEKPAEQKTEDAKPEDKPAESPDDDPLTLNPDAPIATSALAKALESPEAQAALEKLGISRNQLFATARIAAKGQKVLGMFNNDVETAQHAAQEAELFGGFTKAFTELETPDDARALMSKMAELDYVLDDDGKPVIDEATQRPQTNGSMGKFLDLAFQIGVDYWLKAGEKLGNKDVVAAAETLQQVMNSRPGSASEKDYSHLDEETRARLEQADAREKEVATREAADRNRKGQEFEVNVAKGIEDRLTTEIKGLFKDAALTEGQLNWAVNQVKEKAIEKLKSSPLFFTKLDSLMRRRMSDKTMQNRVAHGINSARPLLPDVARQVLEELGVQVTAQKSVADKKLATQQAASRSEVKAAQVAKPGGLPSPAELNKMVHDEFVAKHGRPPKSEEHFRGVFLKKRELGIA